MRKKLDSSLTGSYHQNEISCSYPFWQKLWVSVLVLPFGLAGLLVAFDIVSDLIVVGQGLASGATPHIQELIGEIVPLAGLAAFSLLFPFLLLSMYSDVHLSEEGIRVQVIGLWWIFVPWQDVLDIRPTVQASLLGHRRSQVVFVRKLTWLHWIIGWVLGLKPRPAFNIKGTQTGYDDAVRMIKGKLGKV
jgi:hypothetical protein